MRARLIQWATEIVGPDFASLVIPDQPILSTIGGIIAVLLAVWISRRDGLVWWKTLLAGGAAAGLATVGARLLWALTKLDSVISDPSLLWDPWRGGAVSFGALGGAAIGAVAALLILKGPIWRHCDAMFPSGLVGIAFARVGCLMRSCDYGIPSDVPWAIRYPSRSNTWRRHVHEDLIPPTSDLSLAVHPFPLYLSAWCIFCAVLVIQKPNLFGSAPGQRALACGMLWVLGRFAIEFLRHPGNAPMILGPINLGQVFSIVGVLAMGALYMYLGRAHAKTLQAHTTQT